MFIRGSNPLSVDGSATRMRRAILKGFSHDHGFGQEMFLRVVQREARSKGLKCESPGHRPGKNGSRQKKPKTGEMMRHYSIQPLQGICVRDCLIPGAMLARPSCTLEKRGGLDEVALPTIIEYTSAAYELSSHVTERKSCRRQMLVLGFGILFVTLMS